MIFGINTTHDISKLSQISKSLVVFMPNITTNHAITYANISALKACLSKNKGYYENLQK